MFRNPALPFAPARRCHARRAITLVAALVTSLVAPGMAAAAPGPDADSGVITTDLARTLASWTSEQAHAGAAAAAGGVRVEVQLGRLDPRLRLAPCARIEPYLPGNSRPWGRTRVGLRCVDGPTRWNVFLPVQVQVFGPATVLNTPLPAGAEILPEHLTEAEVDWADGRQPVVTDPEQLIGRRLTRALSAGEPLRATDLQRAVWFQAGDTVKLVAVGPGFEVSAQGQALARGIDGQTVRVRTAGGRIVSGTAVAERRVEMPL
ncbi:MAG: flagellar basal body P-ring formation protein FlgA [Burkholderiaceae bacterium]|nr:flagellar basal body P-ring formation protein FlgA [Burkholderiaceae bacterium]